MGIDYLLDHSIETPRVFAFYNALKLVGEMEIKPMRVESWLDDFYDFGHDPEIDIPVDDGWMDDFDEAA